MLPASCQRPRIEQLRGQRHLQVRLGRAGQAFEQAAHRRLALADSHTRLGFGDDLVAGRGQYWSMRRRYSVSGLHAGRRIDDLALEHDQHGRQRAHAEVLRDLDLAVGIDDRDRKSPWYSAAEFLQRRAERSSPTCRSGTRRAPAPAWSCR